jgi:CubicO group peptidase (beta-lactamase class C family)
MTVRPDRSTTPRLYLLVALLCLAALIFQPRRLAVQTVLPPEIQRRIESVGACLTAPVVENDDPHACQTLQDRMAADRVPGVSIAVIHNGEIEWARGFGVVPRSISQQIALNSQSIPAAQLLQGLEFA